MDKITCSCGCTICKSSMSRHLKSKKHAGGEEKRNQVGDGRITDFVKRSLNVVKNVASKVGLAPRTRLNNISTRTLAQFGNHQITSLKIARAPIQRFIGVIANAVSGGKWDALKQQMGYDKLVHLSLRATVNNQEILIEKNAVPEITTRIPSNSNTQYMVVPITQKITLNEFIEKGIRAMGMSTFLEYSANRLNCQHFVINLLSANGMNTPQIQAFVVQDIQQIFAKLPEYMSIMANTMTYTGSVADKLLGRGKKRNNARKHDLTMVKKNNE